MTRNATATRTRIMDAAEALILDYGFAASSIDRIIEQAGVTKGSFFYYFKTKAELAHALVRRWAEGDAALIRDNMAEAESRSDDPLEQALTFVRLFEGMMDELVEPYPGCLFASYTYEAGLFDEETLEVSRDAMTLWRERLGGKFREVMAMYPPREPVTPESLADFINVTFEGAFILSKTFRDPAVIAEQLGHYRRYIQYLFGR